MPRAASPCRPVPDSAMLGSSWARGLLRKARPEVKRAYTPAHDSGPGDAHRVRGRDSRFLAPRRGRAGSVVIEDPPELQVNVGEGAAELLYRKHRLRALRLWR